MADPIIELQELLNRAAGPGKIGPDKPLETRLYGANGQPIGTAGNPLQVKAQDTDSALGQIKAALGPLATETKLEAVRTLLAAIAEKDFATQGTLAQVKQALDTLNGLVSTSAGQTAIADSIQTLSDVVATQQTLAQAVTQLTNIVNKLNSTLTVDGKVELKGSLPAGAETIGGVTFQGSRNGEIEYLLNAVSVPPGGNTGYVPLDYKGCRKVVLGVQSSQPWKIDTNTPWGTGIGPSDGPSALFSTTDLSQIQNPVTSGNYPRQIVVGYGIGKLDIQEYAFVEALGLAILPPRLRVRVENLSPDSVSTVTVKIMRIW